MKSEVKSMRHSLLFFSSMFLAFLLLPLGAEKAAGAPEGNTFTCLQWEPLPYASLFYKKGKEYLPLPLRSMRRSIPLIMDPGGTFELFVEKPDEKGLMKYEKIAGTTFSPSFRRVLFILDPIPNFSPGEEEIQITTLEDDLQGFPKGSFKFFNTTPETVRVEFSGNPQTIQPQSTGVIRLSVTKESFVPFLIYDEKNNIIYQNQLYFNPSFRDLAIIKASSGIAEKIEMKFLSETIQDEPVKNNPTPGTP